MDFARGGAGGIRRMNETGCPGCAAHAFDACHPLCDERIRREKTFAIDHAGQWPVFVLGMTALDRPKTTTKVPSLEDRWAECDMRGLPRELPSISPLVHS